MLKTFDAHLLQLCTYMYMLRFVSANNSSLCKLNISYFMSNKLTGILITFYCKDIVANVMYV